MCPSVPSQEQLELLQGTGMEEEVDQDRQRFADFWTHHVRPLLEDALGKARVPDGEAFQAYPYPYLYMYVPECLRRMAKRSRVHIYVCMYL